MSFNWAQPGGCLKLEDLERYKLQMYNYPSTQAPPETAREFLARNKHKLAALGPLYYAQQMAANQRLNLEIDHLNQQMEGTL